MFCTRASAWCGGLPAIGVAGNGEVVEDGVEEAGQRAVGLGHQLAAQALGLDVVDRPVEAAELEGGAQLGAERPGRVRRSAA